MNWFAVIAGLIGAVFGGGGAGAIIVALGRRETMSASAEVALSEEARQWVTDFQEDARAARVEASAARVDAAAVHQELRVIRSEAEQVSRYLLRVLNWIDKPGMNIGRLRQLVANAPAPVGYTNGGPKPNPPPEPGRGRSS